MATLTPHSPSSKALSLSQGSAQLMLLASLDELRQAGLDPQLLRPNVRFAEVARLGGHGQLLIDGQAITLDMPVYPGDSINVPKRMW